MSSNPLNPRKMNRRYKTDGPGLGLNQMNPNRPLPPLPLPLPHPMNTHRPPPFPMNTMGEPPGIQAPWRLYNEKATIYDNEMIKEWEDNLSILLVFAALFSAVLTGFIIASMQLLQENPVDTSQKILLSISQQLANTSLPAYQPVNFEAPTWSIRVNFLYFASLGCSLFAALASVLALQWIRDFDNGLARITDPRTRALRRHFRFDGVHKWWMPEMIALMPSLLHFSLLLFLGGSVEWLRHINMVVASTAMLTLAIASLFYVVTIAIAAAYPSAPFRSSISRLVEEMALTIIHHIRSSYNRMVLVVLHRPELSKGDMPSSKVKATQLHEEREQHIITQDEPLPSSVLGWLINHVEISEASVPAVSGIITTLFGGEFHSTIATPAVLQSASWPTVIEQISKALADNRIRSRKFSFSPDTFGYASVLLGACSILGLSNLGDVTTEILEASLYIIPDDISIPQSYSIRFALWRSGKPRIEDATDVPISLFSGVCRYVPIGGQLIVCLREIKRYLATKRVTGNFVFTCLSQVLDHDAEKGRRNVFVAPGFSKEVFTLAFAALQELCDDFEHRPRRSEVLNGAADLFNAYRELQTMNAASPQVDVFFRGLLSTLLLYIPSAECSRHSMLEAFDILKQSSIQPFWKDFQPRAFNKARLLQFTIAQNPEILALLGWSHVKTTTAGMELTFTIAEILTSLSPVNYPSTASKLLFESISTWAIALHYAAGGQASIPAYDLRVNPVPWLKWVLLALKTGMQDPTFHSTVSLMMSSDVRRAAHTVLYCERTDELAADIMSIDDPVLIFIGFSLLGWEYVPDDASLAWNTPAWKIAIFGWIHEFPDDASAPCANMLLAISHRKDSYFNQRLHWYIARRIRQTITRQQNYSTPDPQGLKILLLTIIPAFVNMPHDQQVIKDAFIRLTALTNFLPQFIECGGLDWLVTTGQPDILSGHHSGPHGTTPLEVLDELTRGGETIRTLSSEHCQSILNSSIICDFPNDKRTAILLATIRAVQEHLHSITTARGRFERVANCCEMILNRRIQEEIGYNTRRNTRHMSGPDFPRDDVEFAEVRRVEEDEDKEEDGYDEWCEGLRYLIKQLRAGDVSEA